MIEGDLSNSSRQNTHTYGINTSRSRSEPAPSLTNNYTVVFTSFFTFFQQFRFFYALCRLPTTETLKVNLLHPNTHTKVSIGPSCFMLLKYVLIEKNDVSVSRHVQCRIFTLSKTIFRSVAIDCKKNLTRAPRMHKSHARAHTHVRPGVYACTPRVTPFDNHSPHKAGFDLGG